MCRNHTGKYEKGNNKLVGLLYVVLNMFSDVSLTTLKQLGTHSSAAVG